MYDLIKKGFARTLRILPFDVTIDGDLTVSGGQTIVGSVSTQETSITLNSDLAGAPSQNISIIANRGTSTDAVVKWNETTDKWQAGLEGSESDILLASDLPSVDGTVEASKVVTADASKNVSGINDLTVDGNIVIGTSGKGIDFSATSDESGSATSEILNDYEEGTWTGELRGSTAQATTPVTRTGYYTKIGRQVTFSIRFSNVDTTGATGSMQITGLPYTSGLTYYTGAVMSYGLSVPSLYNVYEIASSSTTMNFFSISDDGVWTAVEITAGTGKYLLVTGTYFTSQ